MKKYWKNILTTVILAGVILTPALIFVKQVDAYGGSAPSAVKSLTNTTNTTNDGGMAVKILKKVFAWIAHIFQLLCSWLLGIAGYLLDASIDYSIKGGENGGSSSLAVVNEGWSVTRDIVNLFFVFILLYIAIATILQIGGYGMKDLLIKVIVVAVLINFSLIITKAVIYSSNVLAMEFYSKITSISYKGGQVSASVALVEALNPEQLFGPIDVTTNPNQDATLFQTIIIGIFGGLVILIIAFVFFAAAFFFIMRTGVLWLLMILAPLAFIAMILPGTKQYWSKWLTTLFNQSFFAPAYLFMLYLSMKIITSGAIMSQLKSDNSTFGTAFGSPNNVNINLILNFLILIVLITASLIIAKQMGAVGASTAISWGDKIKKGVQGYAGALPGRLARRATAPLAEKVATSSNWAARTIRTIPGVTRGAATIAAAQRAKIGETEKTFEKYNNAELKNMITMTSRLKPIERTAITNILGKRGDLKTGGGLKDERITKSREYLEKYGMGKEASDINKLRPDLIAKREDREKAFKGANWEKMDNAVVNKIFSDQAMRDEVIRNCSSSAAKKVLDVGGRAEEEFFKSIANLGGGIDEIAKKLENMGNRSLAGWVRGGPGATAILVSYGMPEPQKEEKEKTEQKPPTSSKSEDVYHGYRDEFYGK